MKRLLNANSPLGIALTVAGVVLALSPEARKSTRQLLVKGTAALLGITEQVRNVAAGSTDKSFESSNSSSMAGLKIGSDSHD